MKAGFCGSIASATVIVKRSEGREDDPLVKFRSTYEVPYLQTAMGELGN
jgi:hypothetical protein